MIVDAAVRVAARAEPDGLTGKALGNELYVAHPYVGAAVACRTLRGPGELAAIKTRRSLSRSLPRSMVWPTSSDTTDLATDQDGRPASS